MEVHQRLHQVHERDRSVRFDRTMERQIQLKKTHSLSDILSSNIFARLWATFNKTVASSIWPMATLRHPVQNQNIKPKETISLKVEVAGVEPVFG